MRLSDRLLLQSIERTDRLDYVLIDTEGGAEFVFSALELARLVGAVEWFATVGNDSDLMQTLAAARRERDASVERNAARFPESASDTVVRQRDYVTELIENPRTVD